MAVDVSGSSHLLPRYPEMASLQLIRQASRGLRDDLEATRHRVKVKLVAVECLKGVATREALGEFDMTQNITQHTAIGVRRHRPHPASPARANEASKHR